jgi:predicted nucleic-acid-binding Zn-ribbon protein
MEKNEFVTTIENKDRKTNSGEYKPTTLNASLEINFGQWQGRKVENHYEYSPLDECPRCGEFNYAYFAFERVGTVRSDKILRGAHCRNCQYTDEVNGDPSKKRNSEY